MKGIFLVATLRRRVRIVEEPASFAPDMDMIGFNSILMI